MAKVSGEKSARCSSGSLMRLGAVRDVVLARVPLADHRTLGYTCKALRRVVYSDDFAKLRKTLGFEESGLLLLAGRTYSPGVDQKSFLCLTHNLESLGFLPPDSIPCGLDEFTTALSTDGRLIVCGDANYDRKVLVYDTREHEWVRDSRYPATLPGTMYGQCTAFLGNTLVVVAGGTDEAASPWGFSWDEQLRMWQSLPPAPTAVTHPGYCVIGSRLFVVGGYTHDVAHSDHYGGGNPTMNNYSARLQIFDMTTRTWSIGPPLTALRDRFEFPASAVAYEDRLYVFCRRSGQSDERRAHFFHAYCFDPRSNSWLELPALPVRSDSKLVACVHDGRLVVVGTRNESMYDPATFHYEWDDRAETWKKQPLLLDDVSAWPAWHVQLGSLISVPLRIG
jgi:hypothetical protein